MAEGIGGGVIAYYEFVNRLGRRKTVWSPMAELDALTERMKKIGWRRVLSVPYYHSYPNYQEAMEESEQVLQDEEKQMAKDRVEAHRDLAQAVKDEYGTP